MSDPTASPRRAALTTFALALGSSIMLAGRTRAQSVTASVDEVYADDHGNIAGNASAAIVAAFATGARLVKLRSTSVYNCTTNLMIPPYCTLEGSIGALELATTQSYSGIGSHLVLGSGVTISMSEGALFRQALITRSGLTLPATTLANARALPGNFSGTAVTYAGQDCVCEDLVILGFAKAIYSNNYGRPKARHIRLDCTSGIDFSGGGDIGEISTCQAWPYTTVAVGPGGDRCLRRSGIAFRLAGNCDWSWGRDNFSYGYSIGYQRDGCSNVKWDNCQADYTNPNDGSDAGLANTGGFQNINAVSYARDVNCTAIAQVNAIQHSTTLSNLTGGMLSVSDGVYASSSDNILVNGSGGVDLDGGGFYSGASCLRFSTSSGVFANADGMFLGQLVTDFVFDTPSYAEFLSIGSIVREGNGSTPSRLLNSLIVAPSSLQGSLTINDERNVTVGNGGIARFTARLTGGVESQATIRANLLSGTVGSEASSLVFGTQTAGAIVESWSILDTGHLMPKADVTYDIGAASSRVRNIYPNKLLLNSIAVVPTEGQSVLIDSVYLRVVVNPAGPLNSLTLTIDQSGQSLPGDEFEMLFTQSIGTLTLDRAGGAVINTITSISAGRRVTVWNVAGTFYAGVN